jgi:prophage antirepressor-like protein
MSQKEAIKIFEEKKVRTVWDDEQEKWYFSIVDVCTVLTDSKDATAYWRKLKQRLKAEGNETVTNCHALKLRLTCLTSNFSGALHFDTPSFSPME